MSSSLRVTLLGSGSPSPSLSRCQPAALVEWGDGASALIDAGDGVVAQLMRSGVGLGTVEAVLLTHMHWDHILGYPSFVWGTWIAGRRRLRTFGPKGIADMHERLVESYYRDQAEWAIELGFSREGWDDVEIEEVAPGWSTEIDGCVISAGAVVHPPMEAVAYRFEFGGRSLVISGDTAACDELTAFAAGVDMLVVDACAAPPPPSAPAQRQALIERLRGFHASPGECVEMAERAAVGHVVLTHHLPDVVPTVERGDYSGQITIGGDLQTFVV